MTACIFGCLVFLPQRVVRCLPGLHLAVAMSPSLLLELAQLNWGTAFELGGGVLNHLLFALAL